MQLCIDQGNSSIKVGIFEGDNLIETFIFQQFGEKEITRLFSSYPITATIFSTVALRDELLISQLKKTSKFFLELTHTTPIPIENKYATPESLGKDRLAGVIGAAFLKSGCDLLVIDAGSAITYDFIDSQGAYWGGSISPGIDLRFRALNEFTKKLPLVSLDESETDLRFLGNDTTTSISSGVLYGIVFEIDGYIDNLKKQCPELSIFLTGGNAFYLVNKLKNAIFANRNLVLIGLNRILQHNV